MRKTAITLGVVLLVSMMICTASLLTVQKSMDHIDDLRVKSYQQAASGDAKGAMETLVTIASHWEKALPLLEVLSSHDDMHDVSKAIIDAQICLEFGEMDDCCRTLRLMGETLEHIRNMEAMRMSNLY